MVNKVIKFFSKLSSAASGSRRFLSGVIFSFAIIMLMQHAAGCTVQFTPGDGICGNGEMEGDEMCDGSDFGGKTCADWSSYEHGEIVCTEDCKVDFTMCHTCGDGRLEGPEDCDGESLNGETCESLGGQPGGDLSCRTDCSFDLTGCEGICGNGVKEEGEECDYEDLGGATCESLGFESGVLICKSNCEYETFGCETSECGNGVKEEGEECDGEDLEGETCESLGHGKGTLLCSVNCTYDTADCETGSVCGNNVREGSEVCDDTALGGETCVSQGFYEGTLDCNDDCMEFDTSGCSGYCGDDVINGEEVCDGSELGEETCETQGFVAGDLFCLVDCSGFDTSGCLKGPPLTWITISGGSFDMGCNDAQSNEQPVHSVTVPTFEMTKTQVTVEQYEECVTAEECTALSINYIECNWDDPGYEDHPANCITWYGAREFCEWAGGRLPSEAEWEYAARSGGQNITYPWGSDTATCDYAVMDDGGYGCVTGRTWSVCSKLAGKTEQGLCDMAGNVWEWVEDDWHSDYNGAPDDGSAWVDEPRGSYRIIRGGSFYNTAGYLRAAYRGAYVPADYSGSYGFRCAR